MLENIDITKVLFLDIETVPQYPDYESLPDNWKPLWDKKGARIAKEDQTPAEAYDMAAIFAEFGKIVCVSVGIFVKEGTAYQFRLKSFYGHDEKELLEGFCNLLNSSFNTPKHQLAAHNGKEFDFPYICRRCIVHGVKLPLILDIAGKKPWEINHLDTMELWKFGDYKAYTSIVLLANLLGIPTPKDDIDGSQVWKVYYHDNDLDRIVTYCQKDVVTVAQIMLKYRREPILREDQIIIT